MKNFNLKPALRQALEELGFSQPTPIQSEAIPPLLEGRDLMGQAHTGSGKTLAYCLPMLNRIDNADRTLQALVLCPTRELADQVTREVRRLGRHIPGLRAVTLVGGQPIGPQLGALEAGCHLAIGTPGRVLDHLRRRSLSLAGVGYLVLDEADRMLDLGFQEEMDEILRQPGQRQVALFSATFTSSLKELAGLKNPVQVAIETERPEIQQIAYTFSGSKEEALITTLEFHRPESAVLFCNLKATVAELAGYLGELGYSAEGLHGDLDQTDRDRIMAKFRNGSLRILIATDVAARGIDIEAVDLVLNFDLPKPDVYVHRIGRTGRAGRKGLAISLVEARDRPKLKQLGLQPAPLPAAAADPAWKAPARTTLFFAAGRKDKLRPGDILGALTGEAGLRAEQVGLIEIHDRFSYVAIDRKMVEATLRKLRNGKIKGRRLRVEKVR
jgi:ATP-dependent RNA helicase DbpA